MSTPLSTAELDEIEARFDLAKIEIFEDNWDPRRVIRDLLHATKYYKQEAEELYRTLDEDRALIMKLTKLR